jgi:multimeric flavodoxin WrbA
MKILLICGSPRNGNTQAMLEKVIEGADNRGAETEIVFLPEMDIKQCDGCMACETTSECRMDDDMGVLYPKLVAADVLVFGTPTYFDNVTGTFKIFIDRTNPFYEEKMLKDKPYAVVVCGGMKIGEGSIEKCVEAVKNFAALHEMKFIDFVMGSAAKPREIEKDEEKMKECLELGRRLANL